ncbi:MAG: hypothetical protein NVS9B4_22130 [Candidatus Acidiferrum sp.]
MGEQVAKPRIRDLRGKPGAKRGWESMIFGFNTNVKAGNSTYHVQTEDRGLANALIDTVVYCGGRIIHRHTGNYLDLLPLDADREAALKLRLDEQHRGVVEAIRSGALQVAPPPQSQVREVSSELKLTLMNARNWLAGKHATLQIAVRDQAGNAVGNAKVTVRVTGAAEPAEFFSETGNDGCAQVEFDMPKLSANLSGKDAAAAGTVPAVVIEAAKGDANGAKDAKGMLRFQLRTKSPATSSTPPAS